MGPTKEQKVSWALVTLVLAFELAGIAFASYVFTSALAIEYLIKQQERTGAAVVVLILYWILLLPAVSPLVRQLINLATGPPYVPVTGLRYADPEKAFTQPIQGFGNVAPFHPEARPAFICNGEGLPRWCHICAGWKPDRAHHSTNCCRCVERMDHYCPWFAGVIGDNNTKFFVQFTFFTAVWCLYGIITLSCFIHEQRMAGAINTHNFITMCVALGLMVFFFNFTAGMSYCIMWRVWVNLTEIESISSQRWAVALNINHYSKQLRSASRPESDIPPLQYATRYFWEDKSEFLRPQSVPAMEDARLGKGTAFAIIHLKLEENVFDLGSGMANWRSVMGESVWDWFLPIRRSPEAINSFGPLLDELADKYKITRRQ